MLLCRHLRFVSALLEEEQGPQNVLWLRMREIAIMEERNLNHVPGSHHNSRIDSDVLQRKAGSAPLRFFVLLLLKKAREAPSQ